MMSRFIYVLSIVLLFAGCTNRFRSPSVELPDRYLYSQPLDTTQVIVNVKWWEIFGDTTLNALIERAIENNQDVSVALSRIEQAQLQAKINRAQYLPGLSMGVSGEMDHTIQTKRVDEYIAKPSISWEISLFGALKNTSRAARAEILSAEYNYNGVMLTLASEVATTYFTLIQNRQSLAISRQSYVLWRTSTAIIDSMVRYGMSSAVDLEQSQGLTATASADIPQYERAIAQTQNSLCTLLGENPHYIESQLTFTSAGKYDSLPAYVPAGLPADLLNRRPDIMQAYSTMMVASAEVGIAQAARLPAISLTVNGGFLATAFKDLTSPTPWAWTALLSITQPVFQFGKYRRSEQSAREAYKQSELNYRKTIISALADVDNALVSISTLRDQALKYKALVVANEKIQMMTSELYKVGLIDYLNVLDAERTLYSSQIEYYNIIQQQFSAYTSLYKALGGGW